jgi:outer membrane protein assembly factor BamB
MRKAGILLGCLLFVCAFICGLGLTGALTAGLLPSGKVEAHEFPLAEKWQFVADGKIGGTPVFYQGSIAFRTSQRLYVVDAATGTLQWSTDLPPQSDPAPPVIANGIVVVTHPEGITAYDIVSGDKRWQIKENWDVARHFPAAAGEDLVVVVGLNVSIHDIHNGKQLWRIAEPGLHSFTVASLSDSKLIVILSGQIQTYDARTGKRLWSDTDKVWRPSYSVLEDNILYLSTEEGLGAFSIQENETLWLREDIDASRYPVTKQGDTLIIGADFARPVAVNALTGRTVWEATEAATDLYQTPLVMDDIVYIRSLFRNRIYALSLQDGSVIGYLQLGTRHIIAVPSYAYSLGPISAESLLVFPVGKVLYAYGE